MAESKSKSLPQFQSLDELVEFFETHDTSDYWEQMPEARFEINIQRRMRLVAIDEALLEKLSMIANAEEISTEALIDSYLREKMR